MKLNITSHVNPQHWRRFAYGIIFVSLILKFIAIFVQQTIHLDTNYYLNIGSNFALRGQITPYMWRLGETNIIAGSGTGYAIYILAYWFKIFGISITSGRLLTYLVGLLSLPIFYNFVRIMWNRDIALVATAFTSISYMFFWHFYVRMDAFGTFAYCVVLLLFAIARRQNKTWLHFLVGVMVIIAAEFHVLALLYAGSLSLYYVYIYASILFQKRKIIIYQPTIAFLTGALITGIIYLLIHVYPDQESYFIIINRYQTGFIRKELERFIQFIYFMPFESILFFMSIVVLLKRRKKTDSDYLVMLIGYLLAMLVISPIASIHYTSHLYPLMGPAIGILFIEGWNKITPVNYRRFMTAIIATLAMISFRTVNLTFQEQRPSNAINICNLAKTPQIEYIKQLPINTIITSETEYLSYAWIPEYTNYMTVNDGEEYGIALRKETYENFWEREKPDVFIGSDIPDSLQPYLETESFVNVMQDLWVRESLVLENYTGIIMMNVNIDKDRWIPLNCPQAIYK